MALSVTALPDVEAFLATAGPFLAAREAEHNLLFGICDSLRHVPEAFDEPASFHVVRNGAGIAAATLRTPPANQVLSMVDDLAAVDALVEALSADLPGVLGPRDAAGRFSDCWMAATGGRAVVTVAERIHRLERVIPPPAPGGRWRLVEAADRELLARWLRAFAAEALPDDPPGDPEAIADRWVRGVGRATYVWVDADGGVVSLVGAGGTTPNGIRVGPVYTPPEHRNRGYASALTAAASQDQLDRGRRFVFLFTDLANPTSNHIYATIGFEPVVDVDQYRFRLDA